jgi:hypothetical protein
MMDSHFAEGAIPHLCIIPWPLPYNRKNCVKTQVFSSSSNKEEEKKEEEEMTTCWLF